MDAKIIPWILSGLTLAVTVYWNWNNRRYTEKRADGLQSAAFDLSNWKDRRDPVLTSLREFEAKGHEITALAVGNDTLPSIIEKIHAAGRMLTISYLALAKDLGRVGSTSNLGSQWKKLADGVVSDGETDWDRLNTIIAEATNVDIVANADACRQKLNQIDPLVTSISSGIMEEIEAENRHHDPERGKY